MASKTRKSIDEAKAYVNTMSAKELWDYFIKKAYYGLHDLELDLAVQKVGRV